MENGGTTTVRTRRDYAAVGPAHSIQKSLQGLRPVATAQESFLGRRFACHIEFCTSSLKCNNTLAAYHKTNIPPSSARWENLQPKLRVQLLCQAELPETGLRVLLSGPSAGATLHDSISEENCPLLSRCTRHAGSHTAGVHRPGIKSLQSQAIEPTLLDPHSSVKWTRDPPLL